MALIEVKNLTYRYPDESEAVFEDVNFCINQGELVLLAGCCGSGKSTLLKCLSGIIPHLLSGHLKGQVYLDGKSVEKTSPAEIVTKTGVVWQNIDAQILHHRVEDELVFSMENLALPASEITKRLSDILPVVELDKNAIISTLSGGQKQRLIIGSVLCMNAPLLLLDEPLANLDPPAIKRLFVFLKTLCSQGASVIMAEHRIEIAAPHAKRLILLKDKKAVEVKIDKSFPVQEKIAPEPLQNNFNARIKPGSKKDLLKVKGLHISYSKNIIIDNFNLSLYPGEHLVILGNNGSGKTTLLKTLCGAGRDCRTRFESFEINGRKIKRLPANLCRETGLVMQNPHHQLFMDSVHREIAFGARDCQKVDEIISLFGLGDLAGRHPFSLSQGQKRLLALAAALSHKPLLLLLDEPTIGQDSQSLARMIDVLDYISRKLDTAIITATHDRQAAEMLAHRTVLLSGKSCVKQGGRELINEYFNQKN